MKRSRTAVKPNIIDNNGVHPVRIAKSKARSRITNGRDLLPGVDHRSLWMRRFRDVFALHLSDVGDGVSEAEKSILRRATLIEVELERREAVIAAAGEASDLQIEVYQRSANTLRRLLEAIGLQRRAKDIGPSLGQLIAEDQAAERRRLAEERAAREASQ